MGEHDTAIVSRRQAAARMGMGMAFATGNIYAAGGGQAQP
jgi:hypothetical protein